MLVKTNCMCKRKPWKLKSSHVLTQFLTRNQNHVFKCKKKVRESFCSFWIFGEFLFKLYIECCTCNTVGYLNVDGMATNFLNSYLFLDEGFLCWPSQGEHLFDHYLCHGRTRLCMRIVKVALSFFPDIFTLNVKDFHKK